MKKLIEGILIATGVIIGIIIIGFLILWALGAYRNNHYWKFVQTSDGRYFPKKDFTKLSNKNFQTVIALYFNILC